MAVREARTRDGFPAVRWGRHGTLVPYGDGTGRVRREAFRIAAAQGQRWAARRLAVWSSFRRDARRGPYLGRSPKFSSRITVLHNRMLQERVRLAARLVFKHGRDEIAAIQRDLDRQRTDGPADVLALQDVLQVVRRVLHDTAEQDADGLLYLGEEIDEDVTGAVDQEVSRLYNIPLTSAAPSEAVDEWVRVNVALIQSLSDKALTEIEDLVFDAVSGGVPTKTLARDIQQRFGVASSRASLIARDQTAKLAGRIDQERQTTYGITQYMWSISGDERVRQEHADRDGRIFTWAEGAGGIHPGTEFQCRCVASAVMPDEDAAAISAANRARQQAELQILQASPTVQGKIPNRSGFTDWNRKRLRKLRGGVASAVGLP